MLRPGPLTPCQERCDEARSAPCSVLSASECFRAGEGVADALVGGVGHAVDAVGVDLEQDGDAVPGAAGYLCCGNPELSHRDTAAWRRS